MAKHYVANEQETKRYTIEEIIDDRVLHELYLLPFEMSVKDGDVASVMCSYNSVNGPFSCENSILLTRCCAANGGSRVTCSRTSSRFTARRRRCSPEWTTKCLDSRVNMTNPPLVGPWLTPANINAALAAGRITVADIDNSAFAPVSRDVPARHLRPPARSDPDRCGRGRPIARSIGEQSAVLLKNANNLLPLNAAALRSVAVIGRTPTPTRRCPAAAVAVRT